MDRSRQRTDSEARLRDFGRWLRLLRQSRHLSQEQDTPRFIYVTLQHPSPYYDDSYAVNSDNNGPYGEAIMQDLLPAEDHPLLKRDS